jgi:hypothetical protein
MAASLIWPRHLLHPTKRFGLWPSAAGSDFWSRQVLTYVNGGWTSTRFSGVNFPPSGAVALPAQTFSGGFIGGGAEFAVATVPGLYWRNEYRLSSYRPTDLQFSVSGMPIDFFDHQSATVQTITTSVIWKFH